MQQKTRAILLALASIGLAAQTVQAQDWPTRHITMVVPFAAGSASDAVGRVVAAHMSEVLGQQVVIENVGGAGGMTGQARVARAEPDGYQLAFASSDTLTLNQSLYAKPMYNGATDFTPVAYVGALPLVLTVRKDLPVSSIKELAAHAKANKMQFGSSGLGSSSHLTCSTLAAEMGGNIAHVPYRGSGPGLQDLVAGNIDFFCPLLASAMPLIEGKQIKPIVVLGSQRTPFLPDLPSTKEQGIDKIDPSAWFAVVGPKGIPQPIVAKLFKVISDGLDTPVLQERLKRLGVVAAAKDSRPAEALQKLIEAEIAKWSVLVKASGVKLE